MLIPFFICLSLGLILIFGSLAELIHFIRSDRALTEPQTTFGVFVIGLCLSLTSLVFLTTNY